MIWKKGKHPTRAYLIGYQDDKQNGYTITRTFSRFRVLFTGFHRREPIAADTSVKLVRQACEAHAMRVCGVSGGIPQADGASA